MELQEALRLLCSVYTYYDHHAGFRVYAGGVPSHLQAASYAEAWGVVRQSIDLKTTPDGGMQSDRYETG